MNEILILSRSCTHLKMLLNCLKLYSRLQGTKRLNLILKDFHLFPHFNARLLAKWENCFYVI